LQPDASHGQHSFDDDMAGASVSPPGAVQSFVPVLVIRSEPTAGSLPTGFAITRMQSCVDMTGVAEVLLCGQASAINRYAEFARLSPEKVLNGTVVVDVKPQADAAVAVAAPAVSVVNAR
jgi:hypothetical protein